MKIPLIPFALILTAALPFPQTVFAHSVHQTCRSDIFVCGTKSSPKSYYQFANENFNTKYGLDPGDTILIKKGSNGENYISQIDLGLGVSGFPDNKIYLVAERGVEVGWLGLGSEAMNWSISGLYLTDPNHFGFSLGCVGDIEISRCHVNGCSMGIQVISTSDHTYPLNYQRIFFHDNKIENTSNEACYFGYVNNSPIAMDLKIVRDTILNSGRDGIQTRNTNNVLIRDCFLSGVGLNREDGQNHGILFGSNSNGGTVQKCKIIGVTGIGIWNGGWGEFKFLNNEIQAETMGIMSRSSFPEGDIQNVGRQRQVIRSNKIYSFRSIECYYEKNNKTVSVDVEDNCTRGTINIDPSISQVVLNNSDCTINPGKKKNEAKL